MWVPNGGHALVVVYKNDIYYIADVERLESFVRVTSSGKNGVFFNGIPDWLYEGKIFFQDLISIYPIGVENEGSCKTTFLKVRL